MSGTDRKPIKGSHYGMIYTGNKHPSKGKEYRCPVCDETMYWGAAKRHEHRSVGTGTRQENHHERQ